MTCTACGTDNDAGAKFCMTCGTPLAAGGADVPGSASAEAPERPSGDDAGGGGGFDERQAERDLVMSSLPPDQRADAPTQAPRREDIFVSEGDRSDQPDQPEQQPSGRSSELHHDDVLAREAGGGDQGQDLPPAPPSGTESGDAPPPPAGPMAWEAPAPGEGAVAATPPSPAWDPPNEAVPAAGASWDAPADPPPPPASPWGSEQVPPPPSSGGWNAPPPPVAGPTPPPPATWQPPQPPAAPPAPPAWGAPPAPPAPPSQGWPQPAPPAGPPAGSQGPAWGQPGPQAGPQAPGWGQQPGAAQPGYAPSAPSGPPDPNGLGAAVGRLGNSVKKNGKVAIAVAGAVLRDDERVEAAVGGKFEGHPAVLVLTDQALLLVDDRQWKPRVERFDLDQRLQVQGWQDDRTASLTLVIDGRHVVVDQIPDRPLAVELAQRIRHRTGT